MTSNVRIEMIWVQLSPPGRYTRNSNSYGVIIVRGIGGESAPAKDDPDPSVASKILIDTLAQAVDYLNLICSLAKFEIFDPMVAPEICLALALLRLLIAEANW